MSEHVRGNCSLTVAGIIVRVYTQYGWDEEGIMLESHRARAMLQRSGIIIVVVALCVACSGYNMLCLI